MGNLPGSLKQKIRKTCVFTVLEQVTCQVSAQDGTRKYLFGLADGNMVESVLMRYHHGNSVCISTQAGCRMGCRFCASTLDGLVRNLTRRRCWNRFTGSATIRESGFPMWY